MDKTDSPTASPQLSLAIEEVNLVNCLGFEVSTLDQIMTRSGLSFEDVACKLAQLELNGIVQAVPNGYTVNVRG